MDCIEAKILRLFQPFMPSFGFLVKVYCIYKMEFIEFPEKNRVTYSGVSMGPFATKLANKIYVEKVLRECLMFFCITRTGLLV